MALATRGMPSTSAPSDGSRTLTLLESRPVEDGTGPEGTGSEGVTVGSLRLRGAPRNRPRVVWREDVIDNEGAGKKSSKICCIYHKPKRFDESSSEESDSDSDSDSSCGRRHSPNHDHAHPHRPEEPRDHGTAARTGGQSVVHELSEDDDEPNVYERLPSKKSKKGKAILKD